MVYSKQARTTLQSTVDWYSNGFDLQQDVTLTVTARKQDPVYLTWVTDTLRSLRIKNVFGVVTLLY